jgi:hypothetical protein
MGCGTIASSLLLGGGTGMQMYAAEQEKSAMNNATQAEIDRQKQYRDKERGVFQHSLAQSTPDAVASQQQQGAQQYQNAVQQAQAAPLSLAAPALGDAANNDARARMASQQNADWRGYGNIGLQQGLKDLQAGSQLGLLNNQAQASNAVLPLELQSAAHSQDMLANIGKLLNVGGSLIGLSGLTSAPTAGQANLASFDAFNPQLSLASAYNPIQSGVSALPGWGDMISYPAPSYNLPTLNFGL